MNELSFGGYKTVPFISTPHLSGDHERLLEHLLCRFTQSVEEVAPATKYERNG